MIILGIYLNKTYPAIRKVLKENNWYPFGNFDNCHEIFFNKKSNKKLKDQIKKTKTINSELYNCEKHNDSLSISINCIVGKNGEGRCTVGIWFKPLQDDVAHSISKKFQLYKD